MCTHQRPCNPNMTMSAFTTIEMSSSVRDCRPLQGGPDGQRGRCQATVEMSGLKNSRRRMCGLCRQQPFAPRMRTCRRERTLRARELGGSGPGNGIGPVFDTPGRYGPLFLVPVEPVPNDLPCVRKILKCLLPDTVFSGWPKNRLLMPFSSGIYGGTTRQRPSPL